MVAKGGKKQKQVRAVPRSARGARDAASVRAKRRHRIRSGGHSASAVRTPRRALTGSLPTSLPRTTQAPERRAFDRAAQQNGRKERGDKRSDRRDGKPGTLRPAPIPAPFRLVRVSTTARLLAPERPPDPASLPAITGGANKGGRAGPGLPAPRNDGPKPAQKAKAAPAPAVAPSAPGAPARSWGPAAAGPGTPPPTQPAAAPAAAPKWGGATTAADIVRGGPKETAPARQVRPRPRGRAPIAIRRFRAENTPARDDRDARVAFRVFRLDVVFAHGPSLTALP